MWIGTNNAFSFTSVCLIFLFQRYLLLSFPVRAVYCYYLIIWCVMCMSVITASCFNTWPLKKPVNVALSDGLLQDGTIIHTTMWWLACPCIFNVHSCTLITVNYTNNMLLCSYAHTYPANIKLGGLFTFTHIHRVRCSNDTTGGDVSTCGSNSVVSQDGGRRVHQCVRSGLLGLLSVMKMAVKWHNLPIRTLVLHQITL